MLTILAYRLYDNGQAKYNSRYTECRTVNRQMAHASNTGSVITLWFDVSEAMTTRHFTIRAIIAGALKKSRIYANASSLEVIQTSDQPIFFLMLAL